MQNLRPQSSKLKAQSSILLVLCALTGLTGIVVISHLIISWQVSCQLSYHSRQRATSSRPPFNGRADLSSTGHQLAFPNPSYHLYRFIALSCSSRCSLLLVLAGTLVPMHFNGLALRGDAWRRSKQTRLLSPANDDNGVSPLSSCYKACFGVIERHLMGGVDSICRDVQA
jgi:hypothetical protein